MKPYEPFIIPGILLIVCIAAGIGLSHAGKPYGTLLFTAHKLLALAGLILLIMRIIKPLKAAQPPLTGILLMILCAVALLTLFVTGALMSLDTLDQKLMLQLHRVATVLALLAAPLSLYLLRLR